MQASVLPRYSASEKMVNPPMVALRFGNEISCKGVLTGGLTTTYSGPILASDKYAEVTIDFAITEVDPYDAESIIEYGSFRGLSTSLERSSLLLGDFEARITLIYPSVFFLFIFYFIFVDCHSVY